jgi:hypothetical protein
MEYPAVPLDCQTLDARTGARVSRGCRFCDGTPGYNEPMPGSDRVNPANRPGLKLTYDDYLLFPDDGNRHELIDGEHYVTASPNLRHQRISKNLFWLINSWLEEHPIGSIWYAPLDVVFSNVDVVEPDLL